MRNRIRAFTTILTFATALVSFGLTSISLAEADSKTDKRLKRLLKVAPQADTNKDGVLTLTEAKAFLKARRAKQANRNRLRVKPTHADMREPKGIQNAGVSCVPPLSGGAKHGVSKRGVSKRGVMNSALIN